MFSRCWSPTRFLWKRCGTFISIHNRHADTWSKCIQLCTRYYRNNYMPFFDLFKKKGKEENPPFMSTLTKRAVHLGSIVVLTAVNAHIITALILWHFDLYCTLDRFALSIAGKECDLVQSTVLVSRPLGYATGCISSNSTCIWCRVDGWLNTLKHLRRLQHCQNKSLAWDNCYDYSSVDKCKQMWRSNYVMAKHIFPHLPP